MDNENWLEILKQFLGCKSVKVLEVDEEGYYTLLVEECPIETVALVEAIAEIENVPNGKAIAILVKHLLKRDFNVFEKYGKAFVKKIRELSRCNE